MVKDVTTRTRPKRYPVIIWLKKINLKSVHYHILQYCRKNYLFARFVLSVSKSEHVGHLTVSYISSVCFVSSVDQRTREVTLR